MPYVSPAEHRARCYYYYQLWQECVDYTQIPFDQRTSDMRISLLNRVASMPAFSYTPADDPAALCRFKAAFNAGRPLIAGIVLVHMGIREDDETFARSFTNGVKWKQCKDAFLQLLARQPGPTSFDWSLGTDRRFRKLA